MRGGRTSFERARRWFSAIVVVGFVIAIAFRAIPPKTLPREVFGYGGMVLLVIAAFGRVWAALYLNGRKTKVLCTSGPYSLTRNPLYAFSFLGTVGFAMAFQSFILPVLVAMAFLAYYRAVIGHEEVRMRAAFGAEFDAYCSDVPRLLPRLHGYHNGADRLWIDPRVFLKSLLDSSVFVWAILLLVIAERVVRLPGVSVLPKLWRIF